MTQSNISKVDDTVDEIIESVLLVDAGAFDDTTTLGPEGLDAESLDVVEMAEMIEDEVGVHIPDDDLEDIETVGEVKEYVADRYEPGE